MGEIPIYYIDKCEFCILSIRNISGFTLYLFQGSENIARLLDKKLIPFKVLTYPQA